MPRPIQRKAQKDYPDHGIKKGDLYWYVSMKTGPRSSTIKRSLTPFKASQLTTSAFLGGWYAAQEDFAASSKESDDIRAAAETIRELGNEARESFDNMPEGLQQGDTGQRLETRADEAETAADELDNLADEWDALEEPEEPALGDRDEDDEDYQNELSEYEDAADTYEQEKERIKDAADDLLANAPE